MKISRNPSLRCEILLRHSRHVGSPLVTIVTPSFNQAAFLPDTLQSVRTQSYPHLEHVIVDGASTDGTVELLRAAPGIRWTSEPDRGQVHAINKGFAQARGAVLAWLNSDDLFAPDTVAVAVRSLETTGADLVYGDVTIVDPTGRPLAVSRGIPFDFRILLYGINYIGQQTVFFRRELLERAGPLREDLDLAFDHELWLRMAAHGRFAYCPALQATIRVHPAAKSVTQTQRAQAETTRIRAQYWDRGGAPAWLRRPAAFSLLNGYYRALRRCRIVTRPFHRCAL